MTDRDAPHKNPSRVPLVLQAMDDPAAHHEPRHSLTEEGLMAERIKIEKDGIYKDAEGNQFYMAAGDYTTREVEYVGTREERAQQAAPENKAQPAAPENRSAKKAD